MFQKLEYDGVMRWANRATVAGFTGLLVFLFTAGAAAQINAAPPSVTSLGFGGHPISGISPSVTSLGPRGYTPGFNPAFPNSKPFFGVTTSPFTDGHHHHHHGRGDVPWGGAAYAVPYYYGYYDNGDDSNDPPEDQYNGGPTIFDRRGPGSVPRPPATATDSTNETAEPIQARPSEQPEVAQEQPQTVLVFKDGHQVEVANYAIVGNTLYDLTDGRRRRIALSDLDLDATTKQNDDRGVDFQLPSGS